jgi:hypothetical protein
LTLETTEFGSFEEEEQRRLRQICARILTAISLAEQQLRANIQGEEHGAVHP